MHGKPSIVTANTRQAVFNRTRRLLRGALESGEAEPARPGPGLHHRDARRRRDDPADARPVHRRASPARWPTRPTCRSWPGTTTRPTAACGTPGRRSSSPAAAAARSSSSAWTASAATAGCPCSGTTRPRSATTTQAIRIPERVYQLLEARQRKTLALFQERNNRPPTAGERAADGAVPDELPQPRLPALAVLPAGSTRASRPGSTSLDIGRWVPHQARHSLATSLLRAGASLTHIRRYLGHVSDRMAEHYVHLAQSDLEDVLQQVWVAGPGTASPGELLAGEAAPLTREQAQALAIDLSRRSTPAEGGFCTFQPVVDGGACPWNLDCHNCDKFVLSGADLLYWRRKREQWRLLAEGAPDDATADYLHAYFEPTARAIDGLEKALAGLGLLDDALALDLRKPQDYFHRVWSTAFRASDLAAAGEDEHGRRTTTTGGKRVSTDSAPWPPAARSTEAALGRVRDAITRLRREKTQVSVAAVSRRADVSRTFLYGNPDARAAVAAAIAAGRRAAHPDPRRPGRRARGHLARAGAERRGRAQGRPRRDHRPAHPHRRAPRPGPRPAVRMDRGGHPADHHREHHPQAARPHAHRRQPDPGRAAQGRPGEHPVPRQAHRRPRSPARPAGAASRTI